jgi:hypothetical protein
MGVCFVGFVCEFGGVGAPSFGDVAISGHESE